MSQICDNAGTKGLSFAAASLYIPESQNEFKNDEGGEVGVREEVMTHEDGAEKK